MTRTLIVILASTFLFLFHIGAASAQDKKCTDEVIFEVERFTDRKPTVYYVPFTDYKKKTYSPDTHIMFDFKNPTNKKIKITAIGLRAKDKNLIVEEKHNLIMPPYTQGHRIGLAKKNLMLEVAEYNFFKCEYVK
jgi:hypothetical protein